MDSVEELEQMFLPKNKNEVRFAMIMCGIVLCFCVACVCCCASLLRMNLIILYTLKFAC